MQRIFATIDSFLTCSGNAWLKLVDGLVISVVTLFDLDTLSIRWPTTTPISPAPKGIAHLGMEVES